ncbi:MULTISPECIES: hypothetical protein [unclassified Halomonas]|uniref:hypothetical protein n=1 Tax=unclassified Halomonas TaxID=2609666 RepID=UPI002076692D|nr:MULTISPECIES: hypothetical protein [unclassified Halomonas]
MSYESIQWRKRLERCGWRKFTGARLPRGLIEFHIIQAGKLYSGRCWSENLPGDSSTPGTIAYVVQREDLRTAGVWRRANSGSVGMIVRPAPF